MKAWKAHFFAMGQDARLQDPEVFWQSLLPNIHKAIYMWNAAHGKDYGKRPLGAYIVQMAQATASTSLFSSISSFRPQMLVLILPNALNRD